MPIKGSRKVILSVTRSLDPCHDVFGRRTFPLLLVKQVFTNQDGSTGILYLVTSDTTLDGNGRPMLYQKRWTPVSIPLSHGPRRVIMSHPSPGQRRPQPSGDIQRAFASFVFNY